MTFDLISPLPVPECVRRLRAATDPGWAMGDARPVLGSVGDRSIRLRRRGYYRNASQCWLSGRLSEDAGQTRLHCTVGLHPFLRAFLEYWIAGVLIAGGFVLVRTIRFWLEGASSPNLWLGIVFPLVMAGFGILLLTFGDHLASDEPRFLIEFLERTIDAHEVHEVHEVS